MPTLENLLIDLVAPAGAPAGLADRVTALSDEDWRNIDARAQQHRLRPYLFYAAVEQAKLPIPTDIAKGWRDCARASTVEALLHQRDLVTAIGLFHEEGVDAVALKGAALAFTAYPQPGLRPMRDIDLWVRPADALRAHHVLLAAGYQAVTPGDPEILLETDHQLPLLLAPGGETQIEIHARLFHDAVEEDPSPRDEFLTSCPMIEVAGQSVRVPSPEHQLLHLVVHAAYDHRFDNGPITLPDIAWLTRHHAIDWPAYHAMTGSLRRGSDALLGLVAQRFADAPIEGVEPPEPEAIDMIVRLMAQDLDHRGGANLLSHAGLLASAFPGARRIAALYGERARRIYPLSLLAHW
ncbi:nucleotidyltransferase domain-containing protein [Sphingomicrobium marinum]|uniref:nucleotidyltransferase domain-containing protein n=1 Tax=Sphingomicrobium marinum TaxID=1227950 RepID=UPI00223EED81|nr:nucleotidyltransferase family protein [Sphingomicrobium marinum]